MLLGTKLINWQTDDISKTPSKEIVEFIKEKMRHTGQVLGLISQLITRALKIDNRSEERGEVIDCHFPGAELILKASALNELDTGS